MAYSRIEKVGTLLMVALLIGSIAVTAVFEDAGDGEYRDLVRNLDSAVEAERIGRSSSTSIQNAYRGYRNLVAGENFENGSSLDNLNSTINSSFTGLLLSQNIDSGQVKDLRSDVIRLGGELGTGSGPLYQYSSLFVLVLSVSFSFLGALFCKRFLDWDSLREYKESLEKWREEIQESLGSRKGERKLERKKEKWEKENNRIWMFSFKQAFVYLALFFVGLGWLSFLYADWTVVWIPFDWLTSGLSESIGATFGALGWWGILFFGFSYIFKSLLVPEES